MSTYFRFSPTVLRNIFLLIWMSLTVAAAAPRRVLFVTHSAGFRHDSLATAAEVLRSVGSSSGSYDLTHTEDLSLLNPDSLAGYDALLFFTSGELALSESQRQAILRFVAEGRGFGGFHSATDTLYGWPEYGELIGGWFDGHPWTQQARILVDDDTSPATRNLPSPWTLVEEYYQFRNFNRDRVRVLLSLDMTSVDPNVPGAHGDGSGFPLAWCRLYGTGRVFYTALGHFEGTWRDSNFRNLLEGAMAWLLNDTPEFAAPESISPGTIFSIYGSALATEGATSVSLDGTPLPVLYTSPSQINAVLPLTRTGLPAIANLEVRTATGWQARKIRIADTTPGIFAVTQDRDVAVMWATGLGRPGQQIFATVGGQRAEVLYSGVSPETPGLYQVNVRIPPRTAPGKRSVAIATSPDGPYTSYEATLR